MSRMAALGPAATELQELELLVQVNRPHRLSRLTREIADLHEVVLRCDFVEDWETEVARGLSDSGRRGLLSRVRQGWPGQLQQQPLR